MRAYLLELSGETAASRRAAYRVAAWKTMRLPRRGYLDARVAQLARDQPGEGQPPQGGEPNTCHQRKRPLPAGTRPGRLAWA